MSNTFNESRFHGPATKRATDDANKNVRAFERENNSVDGQFVDKSGNPVSAEEQTRLEGAKQNLVEGERQKIAEAKKQDAQGAAQTNASEKASPPAPAEPPQEDKARKEDIKVAEEPVKPQATAPQVKQLQEKPAQKPQGGKGSWLW